MLSIVLVVGGYSLYSTLGRRKYIKNILLIIYFLFISQFIANDLRLYKQIKPLTDYIKTASWIRDNAEPGNRRVKIMARKTIFAYLANADFISIPCEIDWERINKFALLKEVDYIILDSEFDWGLLDSAKETKGMRLVYQGNYSANHQISVYRPIRSNNRPYDKAD